MFWSKLCKSNGNCGWNLAFPEYISPQLYGICVNTLIMKSVYFRELHNEQEYYCPTIYRAGAAMVSTITSLKSEITVSFCFSERTLTLTPFHYVRNRWRNNNDSNFYTRYYEYRGKFSCLCCHNKTSRYEVPIRDGQLFFWKVVGRGWGGGGWQIILCKHFFWTYMSLQTFFLHRYLFANPFFPHFQCSFYLC